MKKPKGGQCLVFLGTGQVGQFTSSYSERSLKKTAFYLSMNMSTRSEYEIIEREKWVHPNFDIAKKKHAFWELGIGNWELGKEYFCKYGMLPGKITSTDGLPVFFFHYSVPD